MALRRTSVYFLASVLALCWGTGAVSSQALEAQVDGTVEPMDIKMTETTPTQSGGVVWQKEIERIGTEYIRLHIVTEFQGAAQLPDLRLTLTDRDGHVVRVYGPDDLRRRNDFWSSVVHGDFVLITLTSPARLEGLKLRIDQIAFQAYGGAALSTWGKDEKEPIANYATSGVIAAAARPVAKLLFVKGGAARVCTGFMIGPNRMLTNEHCVNDQPTCISTVVLFGYEYRKDGTRSVLNFGEEYECERVVPVRGAVELDYAVLELRGAPGEKWGALSFAERDPVENQELFIIQHPAGKPKQISKVNCALLKVPIQGRGPDTDFSHTCDTVGGSSGSPVLDAGGRVVGLHHYGFGEGQVGAWKENRAVRATMIGGNIRD